jgi:small conductance mechanosensitive channel
LKSPLKTLSFAKNQKSMLLQIDEAVFTQISIEAVNFLFEAGPKLILAIILFFGGRWLIKLVDKGLKAVFEKREVEASLASFLASFLRFFMMAALIIMVISTLGVPTTSFIAVLGAAGLAVGLALQGSLANFAGGVLILLFKPFKVGEWIDAGGKVGSVAKIDILHTTMHTPDNRMIIIPNGGLANSDIINITRMPTRRVDWSVGISYNSDIKKAREVILSVLARDERVFTDPKPVCRLANLGDSSLDLTVRAWVKAEDYWNVFFENLEAIKEALDAAGISIPFPQRDVHLFNHNK